MSAEEWRPIPGFPGYEVSSLGRVLSRRPYTGDGLPARILSAPPGHKGYRTVVLQRDCKGVTMRVHQLVAAAFMGPCPGGLQVRHLDGNNQNNAASNLRYGTPSENELDKVRHGTHPNTRKTHCPQGHPYDEQNTARSKGSRHCRACKRERRRASLLRTAGVRSDAA